MSFLCDLKDITHLLRMELVTGHLLHKQTGDPPHRQTFA
jgi:hypothetical protein